MVNLTEQIRSFGAERALLMSYCVGLPFFEQDVLPYLQETGEGRVTLLISEREYESSFSDFVTGAGIRYRLNPVRLSSPYGVFHPKLYLQVKSREARLLVASANLTPSGFRANLEIVDELSLNENGQGDSRAFGQFAEMLRSLTQLDQRLPKAITRELREISDMLSGWIGNNPMSEAGPHFLHSIEEPLLPQLIQLVPPARVKEIVAVSPFFDEHSTAILELANAYPKSRMRLIKARDEGSLAGKPLTKLKDRLVIDELTGTDDGEGRRLHAKALMLRGSGKEWVFSGSANLTRAAWLVAAKHGGNVETLIAREYDNKPIGRLLYGLKTRRVDPQKLSWSADPIAPRSPAGRLDIIDAYLESRQVVILLATEFSARDVHFGIVIAQGAQRTESDPVIQCNDDGSVLLRVQIPKGYARGEIPIFVTVEVRPASGKVMTAQSWVAVQSALSLTATQRGVRSSTRYLCQRVFADDDVASLVSDAIARFVGELAEVSAQPKGGATGSGKTDESEMEPERTLLVDEFIITDEEVGRLRIATTRTAETLAGLSALLRRMLIVADETEGQPSPGDIGVEGEEPETPVEEGREEEEGEEEKNESQKRDVLNAEELLNELTQRFQLAVREAMAQTVCANAVPFVLNLPEAVIAYLLLNARIRQKLKLEKERDLGYPVREILQDLLSVEGVLLGSSFGWLVRARASEQCRPTLDNLLGDKARVGQLCAFVAAGLAVGGADSIGISPSVLGGLHFVTGEIPGKETIPEIQSQLSKVSAASGGWISVGEMEKVLGSYSPRQLSALLSSQKWSRAVGSTFCQAVEGASGISCGTLHYSFPANIAAQLKRAGEDVVCPFCHHVIVPLKRRSAEIESVLTWFDSALELMR